jgi:hypothetical protein
MRPHKPTVVRSCSPFEVLYQSLFSDSPVGPTWFGRPLLVTKERTKRAARILSTNFLAPATARSRLGEAPRIVANTKDFSLNETRKESTHSLQQAREAKGGWDFGSLVGCRNVVPAEAKGYRSSNNRSIFEFLCFLQSETLLLWKPYLWRRPDSNRTALSLSTDPIRVESREGARPSSFVLRERCRILGRRLSPVAAASERAARSAQPVLSLHVASADSCLSTFSPFRPQPTRKPSAGFPCTLVRLRVAKAAKGAARREGPVLLFFRPK